MTLDEIKSELQRIADHPGDNEIDHGRADKLLCDALYLLGAADIADAFTEARKEFWYAWTT